MHKVTYKHSVLWLVDWTIYKNFKSWLEKSNFLSFRVLVFHDRRGLFIVLIIIIESSTIKNSLFEDKQKHHVIK